MKYPKITSARIRSYRVSTITRRSIGLMLIVFSIFHSNAQTPGNALHFDGANDYVSAGLPTVFSNLTTNDLTVETWLKINGSGTQRVFSAQLNTTNFVSILLNGSNAAYVYIYEPSGNVTANTQVAMPTGTWTHFAFTWDASTNTLTTYLNGVSTSNIAGGSSSTGTDNLMTIGSRTDGSQVFNGELDELRIWDDVRSSCEINASMNSEFSVAQPNLVAYYNFNQGTAGGTNTGITSLPDFTTSYNGTLNNFALSGAASNWIASNAGITQINQNAGTINSTDTQVACGSYVWTDGITYTSSNTTATQTLTAASGCDSIVTLNLTINNPTSGTDVQSACESFTWIDGTTYTASNNSATFLLANAAGCDSIVTLNLTINSPSTGTDIQSACASYTWMDGITYTASNNSATYTLVDVNGCDSVVTLDLTILPLPLTTVSNNSPVLTADVTGASYQWIDCDNGNTPINGATSQVFTATANGNYAVLITQNGCSDTSTCIAVANVGLSDLSYENGLNVYPNPVSSELIVYLANNPFTKLEICTLDGKVLRSIAVESKQVILNVRDLNPGVYLLKLEGSTGVKRFVKI